MEKSRLQNYVAIFKDGCAEEQREDAGGDFVSIKGRS